jgi:hypothetical protein
LSALTWCGLLLRPVSERFGKWLPRPSVLPEGGAA